jgi:hypothetical protein
MEHAIVLRMAECFDLRELVTTPTGKIKFSPSYIQDFLRIILLVVRDRRNTGMNEVKMSSLVIFWFPTTLYIRGCLWQFF